MPFLESLNETLRPGDPAPCWGEPQTGGEARPGPWQKIANEAREAGRPPLIFAREDDEKMSASGQSGRRAGAGRPRVKLDELVVERRFDARNARHRRALLEDALTLPATSARLRFLRAQAEAYRGAVDRGSRASLAQGFGEVARGVDEPW